jgi:organic radical activating enzyme
MTHPSFTSLLISITDACRVGCAHCGLLGAARNREIGSAELARWVEQAGTYSIPLVIFTGGEPFDRFEALRLGVRTAARVGLSSGVFTSSIWAESADAATEALQELEGLRRLYLSTDIYHQRTVPYEYVYHAIAAADRLGIPDITLCITFASEADRQSVRERYLRFGDRVRFYESRAIATAFTSQRLGDQEPGWKPSQETLAETCWLGTPFIDPSGDLFACHAGAVSAHGDPRHLPYWLGNLRSEPLESIMVKARNRPEYQFLRTHGPKGIGLLLEAYPELVRATGRSTFTGPCDLCYAVLATSQGRRCLSAYANDPEVLIRTNVRLALALGEAPLAGPVRSQAPQDPRAAARP